MAKPGFTKNYTADEVIPARRIVKFGTTDHHVALCTAATDLSVGVSELGCTAANDRVDIIRDDLVLIEYGGTVTRGQPLTADATGRAVVAAPAAGSNVRIIGFAEISGVVGDIGECFLSPGIMQG